jgi:acyl dehydratase
MVRSGEGIVTERRQITTIEALKALEGQELGAGPWTTVDQARVDAFCQSVMGANWRAAWMYTDPQRAAKEGPYGGTILPGNMTLSLATLVPANPEGEGNLVMLPYKQAINYGYNRIRWMSPVRVGSRIRSRNKLIRLDEVRPDVYQMTSEVTVEIEGEAKPAMVGENLTWFVM